MSESIPHIKGTVKTIPGRERGKMVSILDSMLEGIAKSKSEDEYFEVDIESIPKLKNINDPRTIENTFPSIAKRIKDKYKGRMKLLKRGNRLFIQKLPELELKEKPEPKQKKKLSSSVKTL